MQPTNIMLSIKKYLPIFAALGIGAVGAAGYAVHAASIVPSSTNAVSQVQTTAQDPQQLDGERADDSQTATGASFSQEAENGPADSGSDNGEAD
jgi:hypothetical protein